MNFCVIPLFKFRPPASLAFKCHKFFITCRLANMLSRKIRSLGCSKTFQYLIITRGIQQNVNLVNSNQFTPVEVDVPWGKISGKLWGSANKQPLLALHGWQDNSGTYDMLAPLLKNSSILAIDLPGHGLSSWLPRGIPYNEDISAESMRLVVKYFGWDKVKLMGHSMGGILCFNYARLYPEETEFVISIDSLAFVPNKMTGHSKRRAQALDKLINFEKKVSNDPPSYPEEVLIKKWIDATKFSDLDVPTTKTLMIRGAHKKADGTYYYTRDFRLTIEGFNSCYTQEEIKEMAQLITCPYLVIKASKTPFFKSNEYWTNVSSILTNTSADFRTVDLEGSHHLHMMQPEEVANEINPFLEKHDV